MGSLRAHLSRQIAMISGSLLFLTPIPSNARDWPDAGGWSIVEATDSCAMMQEYEGKGDTELLLLVALDGGSAVSIKNSGWSAVGGQKYELEFFLNGNSYGGGAAVGNASEYKKGFIAKFGPDFARDFTGGSSLAIYLGDTLVDKLSLKGTAAGMAMIRSCLSALQAEKDAAEREQRRFSHIADDPFATASANVGKASANPTAATPRGSPFTWVTDADYPSRAQREERSGTTGFRLDVGADGRATGCAVTSSSGSPDLDTATCDVVMRRARFSSPPAGGVYDGKQIWRLPQ